MELEETGKYLSNFLYCYLYYYITIFIIYSILLSIVYYLGNFGGWEHSTGYESEEDGSPVVRLAGKTHWMGR